MNRRNFLIHGSAALAGLFVASSPLRLYADQHDHQAGQKLPSLPYAYDALEPHIDKRTMEIHHGKHHQGYVNKLNAAIARSHDLQHMTLEDMLRNIEKVPKHLRQTVINSGGGHANHTLFWSIMKPNGGQPTGEVAEAIQSTFGSIDDGRELFTKTAKTHFGSGWAWLVIDENKKLQIYSTSNQDSPMMKGHIPILGLDIWEHAYYLKYQNRRADYIEAWRKVVNWEQVNTNYLAAMKA